MFQNLILQRALLFVVAEVAKRADKAVTPQACRDAIDAVFTAAATLASKTATSFDDMAVNYLATRVDRDALANHLFALAHDAINVVL